MTKLQRAFLRNWWVLLFMLLCLFFYEQGVRERSALNNKLQNTLEQLQKEKQQLEESVKQLEQQLTSRDDPVFIEYLLKKELGVVGPGETKVYFKSP